MYRYATLLLLCSAAPALAANIPDDQKLRKEEGSPLPLSQSASGMTLAEGFTATLFAGEPDIHQPIGFCIDHRGRLWVCENYSYPKWDSQGRDRILIFEDTDGDGKFDKRTVFAEGFHYLTGVQIGLGGVWVMDCPNLLFFPVNPGEDKPAGKPVVHLEGWNWRGIHNVPNTLTWGPDGWLYGCNGITVDSVVGRPGTPEDQRTRVNCGIWRYHPTKKIFERFAEGTTNPWGLDYESHGQFFMSNNVVPHLWHVIQGAHYRRMHGHDFNPHIYAQIQTIADHLHWGGGDWTSSRGGEGVHSAAGGGHSHAGLLVYSGESFPARYRGTLLMCNTHGHRLNNDILERKGSGFVAKHHPDFLLSNDKWFKGVAIHEGPQGAIFFIDWSDTGECHDYDVTDREHGRIYRVAYKDTKTTPVDLEKESDENLAQMQATGGEWYARRARVILRDRAVAGKLNPPAKSALEKLLDSNEPLARLRTLWTMHQCGLLDGAQLLKMSSDSDEYVRAWAIQLLCDDQRPSDEALKKFADMARGDRSPVVRLYLASALQRTPIEKRWPVLEHLVSRSEDGADQNLPFMYWYALEELVGSDAKLATQQILPKLKIPLLRELTARRVAALR